MKAAITCMTIPYTAKLNAPLGQQAAARLALRHSGQDYWYRNTLTGRPVSRPRDEALRASAQV